MNCVYIAPNDRIKELKDEIKNIVFEKDNFILAKGIQKSFWAQNVWTDVKTEKIESIKKASFFLKAIQRNWWHYPLNHVRRTKLIQESLPRIAAQELKFPFELPKSPLGSFALKSEDELIYSANCSAPLPNGEYIFKSPDYKSPSEAYLKLWEALLRYGKFPQKGELCIDLGSSPGSWTLALLKLGANVLSVDKAKLEIAETPQLSFIKGDAFKLAPEEIESPDWIFSDIICYPDKLYELALKWKAAYPKAHFIFTLKFQKQWDRDSSLKFAHIPNSQLCHLYNNKHELCWISGPQ